MKLNKPANLFEQNEAMPRFTYTLDLEAMRHAATQLQQSIQQFAAEGKAPNPKDTDLTASAPM